jgi:phosphoglycerol transferase
MLKLWVSDRSEPTRPYWMVWAAIFAIAILNIAVKVADEDPNLILYSFPPLLLILLALGFGRRFANGQPTMGWWLPLIPLTMLMVWCVFIQVFGHFSLAPILFHFQYKMESNGVMGSVARQVVMEILPFLLLFVCWRQAARGHRRMQILGGLLTVPFLVFNPFTFGISNHVMRAYASDQLDLTRHFSDPSVATKLQDRQPNLIHIYLESTERTLWHESLFGKTASPLKRLEARGFSATGIIETEKTNWTLAGHIASNCGTPLLGLGATDRNDFDHLNALLPKAVCLSDILARDGYALTFMKGAMLEFAGTDGFVTAHNYDKGIGYGEIGANYPAQVNSIGTRVNPWGIDDEDLFDAAFKEIANLSNGKKPFGVTMTTIGGHSPRGYISRSCLADADVMSLPNQTLQAFYCTNKLTEAFIGKLAKAGILEDTVVVVQSDHLAMRNEIFRQLKSKERRNTFIILKDGFLASESASAATMIDTYPTILEALGYTLPDRKAGLGVSLLSGHTTLVGQVGLDRLNDAILSDYALRDKLWGIEPGT